MTDKKYLTVISDDFGILEPMNEGIFNAFKDGLVTDTNIMAPGLAVDQALQLTKEHDIPVGLHATFTSEWDIVRWRPLTEMTTQCDPDGCFRPTVDGSWEDATYESARAELDTQLARIESAGITCNHIGEHMGVRDLFRQVMRDIALEKNLPHKGWWRSYSGLDFPYYHFNSCICVSDIATTVEEAKAGLINYLKQIRSGYHMWLTHPSVPDSRLDEVCTEKSNSYPWWSKIYRLIDYELVMSDEIKDILHEQNIHITPLAQVPVNRVAMEQPDV